MAKLLLYTDLHFGALASVLRMRKGQYTYKICNGIDTLNFVNRVAQERNCDAIYCLGDEFDRPDLTAEEITALREIDISHHKILVGNHEAISNDLFFNSANVLRSKVYDKPEIVRYGKTQIVMLPYVTESDRVSITKVLDDLQVKNEDPIVIFSHNDIKGINYGAFFTTLGYDKEDIESNCDLFINGHIHNGAWITKKILNLGSVTGINFNNDANIWKPVIAILDTDTLEVELIENPYGIWFFKKEFVDRAKAIQFIEEASKYTNPVVISIKCLEEDHEAISEELSKYDFLYKRVLIDYTKQVIKRTAEDAAELTIDIDYFEKFREFIRDKYQNEDVNCKLMLEEINTIAAG